MDALINIMFGVGKIAFVTPDRNRVTKLFVIVRGLSLESKVSTKWKTLESIDNEDGQKTTAWKISNPLAISSSVTGSLRSFLSTNATNFGKVLFIFLGTLIFRAFGLRD